ncbi:neurobeachin-like isoform X2 [Antedon mediterranea]|uniref:neurobeachin-like isoform X2 n=1 Tax=Antedon mediterranea TaxID=105859 RepID=UPI003AF7D818
MAAEETNDDISEKKSIFADNMPASANASTKVKFGILIGLMEVKEVSDRDIFDTVFNLLVGREFDLECAFIIDDPENVNHLLELMSHCQVTQQAEIWSMFCGIVRRSVLNLQACTSVGLIEKLLDRLPQSEEIIAELLVEIIGVLANYSISVKELKILFKSLKGCDGKWPKYSIKLLQVLRQMPCRHGPDVFFNFPGTVGSAIALPPMSKWPHQNGFTFTTWFRLDPVTNINVDRDKPYLFCFRTGKGVGYSGHFMGSCLVITSVKVKGKGFQHCIKFDFQPRKWYMVSVVHIYHRWKNNEIKCFVNGKLVSSGEMPWHVNVNEPFDKCFLGAAPSADKERTFCGQLACVYLFSEALTPQQIEAIYLMNPNYKNHFKFPSESDVSLSETHKKVLYDGKLSNAIVFMYNPAATESQLCLDSSPKGNPSFFVHSPHALMVQDVRAIVTHSIHSTLHSIGGIQVLFSLFTQLDFETMDGTIDESACMTLLNLLSDLLKGSLCTQQQMLQGRGFVVLGHLLQKASNAHFTNDVLELFIDLAKYFNTLPTGNALLRNIVDHILFNPNLWIFTPAKVQISLYTFLATEFVNQTVIYTSIRRVSTVLQLMHTLKYYYWVINPEARSGITPKAVDGTRPNLEDMKTIRGLLVQIAKQLILREKSANDDELQSVLNFLSTVHEDENIRDILQLLLSLMVENNTSMASAFDKKNGIKVVFKLMASEDEQIRAMSLKVLALFLSRTLLKHKLDLLHGHNLYSLIGERLMLSTSDLTLTMYNGLFELLTERVSIQVQTSRHTEPDKTYRIMNPGMFQIIARLLRQSTPSASVQHVKRLFLSDMILLFNHSRENRRTLLQCSVWQDWMISLSYIYPKTDEEKKISEMVYSLLRMLLHHALKYEWGGWRVWVDTLSIIHSKVSYENHKIELIKAFERYQRQGENSPGGAMSVSAVMDDTSNLRPPEPYSLLSAMTGGDGTDINVSEEYAGSDAGADVTGNEVNSGGDAIQDGEDGKAAEGKDEAETENTEQTTVKQETSEQVNHVGEVTQQGQVNSAQPGQYFSPGPHRAPYRIPEFKWSMMHQRMMSDLLFAIETDIQVWRSHNSKTVIDLVNSAENIIFVQNVTQLISQISDNLIYACGGILPLLSTATSRSNETDVIEPTQDLPLDVGITFLNRIINLVDVLVFASSQNFGELETEKNMNKGGILRQCLRLSCYCAIRNVLECRFRQSPASAGASIRSGQLEESPGQRLQSVINATHPSPKHHRTTRFHHLNIKASSIDARASPNIVDNLTGPMSPVREIERLLQDMDIHRLRAVVYRDVEESKQAQFLSLSIVYFISVLMVARYRDIIEKESGGRRHRSTSGSVVSQDSLPKNEPKSPVVKQESVAEGKKESMAEVKKEPVAEVKKEPVAEVKKEPVAEVKQEPVAEVQKEPVAEIHNPVAEVKESVTEVQNPVAEVKESVTEVQYPVAEVNESVAEVKEYEGDVKEPIAEEKKPVTDGKETEKGSNEAVLKETEPVTSVVDSVNKEAETVEENADASDVKIEVEDEKKTTDAIINENATNEDASAVDQKETSAIEESSKQTDGNEVEAVSEETDVDLEKQTEAVKEENDVSKVESEVSDVNKESGSVEADKQPTENGNETKPIEDVKEEETNSQTPADETVGTPESQVVELVENSVVDSKENAVGEAPSNGDSKQEDGSPQTNGVAEDVPDKSAPSASISSIVVQSDDKSASQTWPWTGSSKEGDGKDVATNDQMHPEGAAIQPVPFPVPSPHALINSNQDSTSVINGASNHEGNNMYSGMGVEEKLTRSLETSAPLLREIFVDFAPFLSKTLLGSHGQELLIEGLISMKSSKSVIELVMMLCSQEWQNSIQKHAGLAFIELINEGRMYSHSTRDHLLRVANEAEFILSRHRAEDVQKHAEFESMCAQNSLDRKDEENMCDHLITAARRRDYIYANQALQKALDMLRTKHGAWGNPGEERPIEFYKLDMWEDNSRRHRRLIRNPHGSHHEEAALRAAIEHSQPDDIVEKAKQALHAQLAAKRPNLQQKDGEEEALNPEDKDLDVESELEGAIVYSTKCSLVAPCVVVRGTLSITSSEVYFEVDEEEDQFKEIDSKILAYSEGLHGRWHFNDIRAIFSRRYLLQNTALEIFLSNRTSVMFNLANKATVKKVVAALPRVGVGLKYAIPPSRRVSLASPKQLFKSSTMTQAWQRRDITNFEYLMYLNTIAGRTYNDINQYPIFPWVLTNYESTELDLTLPSNFRDLSKPIGALNPSRKAFFQERYESWEDDKIPPFHYGTHYSTSAFTLAWLIRIEPFSTFFLNLQGGKFDHATRTFSSMATAWKNSQRDTSDVKELIPEFFYLPDMFVNENKFNFGKLEDGSLVDDVVLPPWAKSPEDFIRINKLALESEFVSCQLHQWIDLIFGYKQRGPEAVRATNVFYYLTYEDSVNLDSIEDPVMREAIENQIKSFGQTPVQLLTEPHPPRSSAMHMTPMMYSDRLQQDVLMIIKFLSNSPVIHVSANTYPVVPTPAIVTVASNQTFAINKWNNQVAEDTGVPGFSMEASKNLLIDMDPLILSQTGMHRRQITDNIDPDIKKKPHCYVVTADNRFIMACGFWDKSFRIYMADTSKVSQVVYGHWDVVTCLVRSECPVSGDCYIVSGSRDATLLVWHWSAKLQWVLGDTHMHGEVATPRSILTGHDTEITCAAVCTELGLVASGAKGGTCLLHTVTGDLLRTLTPPTECTSPRLASMAAETGVILIAYDKGQICSFTINGKFLEMAVVSNTINALRMKAEGDYFITGGDGKVVQVWRTHDLQLMYSFPLCDASILALDIAYGQKTIIAGMATGSIVAFRINFHKWHHEFREAY